MEFTGTECTPIEVMRRVYNELKDGQNQLSESIADISEDLGGLITKNRSINTNNPNNVTVGRLVDGNINTTYTTYFTSDFCDIKDFDGSKVYVLNSQGNGVKPSGYAFYDKNKSFISGYNYSIDQPFIIPINAIYFRFTLSWDAIPALMVIRSNGENLPTSYIQYINEKYVNEDYIPKVSSNERAVRTMNGGGLNWIDGYYIHKNNGLEAPYISYSCTDYYTVNQNGKIYINTLIGDNACIAFYDAEKIFINSVYVSEENVFFADTINVPNKAMYVRISCKTSYIANVEIFNNLVDGINALYDDSIPLLNVSSEVGYCSIFEKINCIGDSLTAGNLNYTSPTNGEYTGSIHTSYPKQLESFIGCECRNYGRGGATAAYNSSNDKSWLNIADNVNNRWLDEDKKANAYIIALGTNDIGYYGTFTGSVSDIDLNNMENTDITTSCGGYGKIIQRILSVQPKAKIFCVCLPNTRNTESTRTEANNKIKAIANLFQQNCYIIDLQTYGVANSEVNLWKSKYYNGGHLNALGYNQLAKMYLSYVNWIIDHNMHDFKNVGFIGTQYDYN